MPVGLLSAVCIASANYVINEWLDRKHDAAHPPSRSGARWPWRCSRAGVYAEYLLFAIAGLILAYLIGTLFFITSVAFLASGILYNVPPIRAKDKPYLDVLMECLNNPIRLLLGWAMVDDGTLPPVSVLAAYWMAGAFLMATKRLGEYRDLSSTAGVDVLRQYRRSFRFYTEESLTVSCLVYAMMSAFLMGIFLVKYRVEYIVVFPFVSGLFAVYLWLATRPARSCNTRSDCSTRAVWTSCSPQPSLPSFSPPSSTCRFSISWPLRPSCRFLRRDEAMTLPNGPVEWDRIRLVVFDLDGTLYDQRRLRAAMLLRLALDAASSRSLAVLRVLKTFRTLPRKAGRDAGRRFCNATIRAARRAARDAPRMPSKRSSKNGLTAGRSMSSIPAAIAACERVFAGLAAQRKTLAVLSDYPAREKLKALGLGADIIVCAGDPDVGVLKPHPAGLQRVLSRAEVPARAAIMIGDRVDRDWAVAQRHGMRALIRSRKPIAGVDTFRDYEDEVFQPIMGRATDR